MEFSTEKVQLYLDVSPCRESGIYPVSRVASPAQGT